MKALILDSFDQMGGSGGCTGHGRCALEPGGVVFHLDDQGYNSARGGVLDIAPEFHEEAQEAARQCPEHAIVLVDEM